ncbi:MAG: PIN domain-containing protein [Candidatus Diapherotrites archaeon]|nr:PIN domain-containing protein [Candidatus Diapherotrites archaeon]
MDSNVLISIIRSEIGKGFEQMYQKVEEFFLKSGKDSIFVLSGLALKETTKICCLGKKEIIDFIRQYNLKFELVEPIRADYIASKEFIRRKIHYPDSLHLAIAIRTECDALVTWNLSDFENAQEIIDIRRPADFI